MENYVFQACFYPSIRSLLMLLSPLSAVMLWLLVKILKNWWRNRNSISSPFYSHRSSPSPLAYSTNNKDYQDQERRPKTKQETTNLLSSFSPNGSAIPKSLVNSQVLQIRSFSTCSVCLCCWVSSRQLGYECPKGCNIRHALYLSLMVGTTIWKGWNPLLVHSTRRWLRLASWWDPSSLWRRLTNAFLHPMLRHGSA